MKYYIDYQYLPLGAQRPRDDGEIVGIEATDASGTVLLPNVGDYVLIDKSTDGGQSLNVSGRVKSKLFQYIDVGSGWFCRVNIVVEQTEDDWRELIKQ